MNGPCEVCGLHATRAGHDPCIAELPGVVFACCGHAGEFDSCYLMFYEDGLTLYGNAARAAMEMLGGSPPPPRPTALSPQTPIVSRYVSYGSYNWPVT